MALVGVPCPHQQISIDPLELLLPCKKLIGVIAGPSNPQTSLRYLVQLHGSGNFPVDNLGKVYSAHQFDEALADLKAGHFVKLIISWDDL